MGVVDGQVWQGWAEIVFSWATSSEAGTAGVGGWDWTHSQVTSPPARLSRSPASEARRVPVCDSSATVLSG